MYPSMLMPAGDPFADAASWQDRLQDLFGPGTPSSIRAVSRAGAFPALNVGTWAEALEIYAFAPGLDAESIDVSVEKGLLTLSGRRAETGRPASGVEVYAKERFEGAFRRVVVLPEDSDATRVEATYRHGVLKIVVPRLESAKPRQISVSR